MFYEDVHIRSVTRPGRGSILARSDHLPLGGGSMRHHRSRPPKVEQPLARLGAACSGGGECANWWTRVASLRAAMAKRGETLPQLGVSPGFKGMRWPYPVYEGDIVSHHSMETVSKRETSSRNGV